MPTPMTEEETQRYIEACEQTDAIFRLEGFEPDEEIRIIRNAIIAGRVTHSQVTQERNHYFNENKSDKGFIETRDWAK